VIAGIACRLLSVVETVVSMRCVTVQFLCDLVGPVGNGGGGGRAVVKWSTCDPL
jgi:hypothetical protein